MKRMMIAALLLCGTVSVFAADNNTSDVMSGRSKVNVKKERDHQEAVTCTVSLSATIGPEYMQATATCSATASTCKEAIATAKGCIDEAKKAML